MSDIPLASTNYWTNILPIDKRRTCFVLFCFCLFPKKLERKQMTSHIPSAPANDNEDTITVEDIEQLCNRMSKYEPCFRIPFMHYHMKRLGISCNDERLVKLLTLSFETMVNK